MNKKLLQNRKLAFKKTTISNVGELGDIAVATGSGCNTCTANDTCECLSVNITCNPVGPCRPKQ